MRIGIGLLGSSGRMGRMVIRLLKEDYAGRAYEAASTGSEGSWDALRATDVIIDFSSPAGTLALLAGTEPGGLPPVASGTTGWDPASRARLADLAAGHTVLLAANFAMGILALRHILAEASPLLIRLGYTPVICETHHRHKKDAPSGTALELARVITPDKPHSVQTHSLRAGEVVGEHAIGFYGPADRISFVHAAQDRSVFARGAIEAALWLAHRQAPRGLMSMDDYFREIRERG